MRILALALASLLLPAFLRAAVVCAAAPDTAIPRYAHVFVIVDENKDYGQIVNGPDSPTFQRLAKSYGVSTNFFAETHPSEPNYVALVGGDTFGIRDDDAYYCKRETVNPHCEKSSQAGYVNHTIDRSDLGLQLQRAGVTWKGYYESIPSSGSLAVVAGDPKFGPKGQYWQLYASKHSGFMNFTSVQRDPNRAAHIVGFDALDADLASGNAPAFALIVPNQCNDMHGLDPSDYSGPAKDVPADCDHHNVPGLIRRGDATIARLVSRIQQSKAWNSRENAAIVITFDEGSHKGRAGGHIPTIVMTNHGVRHVSDPAPYTHYSLLRTLEDAFGIHEYLGHAREAQPMTALFALR